MIDVVSVFTPEYKSNTYILTEVDSHRTIIIDPTLFSITEINNYLLSNALSIDYVIPTHGHFDHIEGIGKLNNTHQFDIIANPECSVAFQDPKKNYSFYIQNKNIRLRSPNIIVEEDIHQFSWNNSQIQIIKTPGHSPCSVCIIVNSSMLFSGDTILMKYSPFSKFPDGDAELLKTSIRKIYSTLPHSTLVYPGHGDSFLLGSIGSKFTFLLNQS
jgi:hydroxyacylglutathione hydrolase